MVPTATTKGRHYGLCLSASVTLPQLYAGRVLNLTSYVMLDSDLVWYKDVYFLCKGNESTSITPPPLCYTTSNQYHPYYYKLNDKLVKDIHPRLHITNKDHKSGIVHHMPIHLEIMEQIFRQGEKRYRGAPHPLTPTNTPLPIFIHHIK